MSSQFDITHNVAPGAHLYQFYKSPEDLVRFIIPYLKSGLEQGDACMWLTDEKDSELIRANVIENLPDFACLLGTPQFQIKSAQAWYLKDGIFDEEQSVKNAIEHMEMIQTLGFKRLRGGGDVGAIPRADWNRVESYEKRIHGLIKGAQIVALCAYPILECALRETRMVIDCHDDVLVGHL